MPRARKKPDGATSFRPPGTISRGDYLRGGSDEWFREVIYTTVQALGRLLACRDAFGRALGLTGSQFAVLMSVAYRQKHQGVSIRDLAQHVSLAPTHVTTEVGKLIHKGYLIKELSLTDRRSVQVSLTSKGEAAVDAVAPLVTRINDLLFQDIDAKDLETVSKIMRRLVLNSEFAKAEIRRRQSVQAIPFGNGRHTAPKHALGD